VKRPRAEAERWLAQAENDLAFAELGAREGFAAQACFLCQQSADKALKALHYLGGERFVPGHSLVELIGPLVPRHAELGALADACRELDQFYVPTRYPNGLPGGTPFEVFTARQAREALRQARAVVSACRALVGSPGG
jgi:HEPN domain-containing protein